VETRNKYFARILVREMDRLGSVSSNTDGSHRYYPYGVEYFPSMHHTEKYATYTCDTASGLDYAMNRYYSSQWVSIK